MVFCKITTTITLRYFHNFHLECHLKECDRDTLNVRSPVSGADDVAKKSTSCVAHFEARENVKRAEKKLRKTQEIVKILESQ